MNYKIAAFYRFVPVSAPKALREQLRATFSDTDLRGTLLIAGEGINGTMSGSPASIDRLVDLLAEKVGLERTEVKFSFSDEPPFKRLKFRIKSEIIAFRKAQVDPTQSGEYVQPQEWNALIADPEVLLLDTRNRYETDLGTFTGATAPGIDTFSDFVTYVQENLDPARHRKVAMFCTGGIRCEKASAFMLQEGFDEIYHLKGGILKYLEEIPEQSSQWQGECYLFDNRTSVGHADLQRHVPEPERKQHGRI
ncbi:rhodanese-related sulfurtransferase [Granulicella sp. S190]|uniref:oxygen-dependent tRNA uridine(34) hydroxylase TrhO n=1 Tax=Granulicella sp. S190 TaxID=1747226 RepID=UPI00131BECBC|nr:rhodanese-related sulfurtransferase [Granulicella sp. S190]